MINPHRGNRILLLGEVEGILARHLSKLPGVEATWMEPGGKAAEEPVPPPLQSQGYVRLQGDFLDLPFADGHFDAVASQFTLDYLEDREKALSEWVRVLKEEGTLALVTRNRLFKGPEQRPGPRPLGTCSPGESIELAEEAGLVVTEISTLIPDLKLAAIYRGDLSFCLFLEKLPYFRTRGRLLFLRAERQRVSEN